ncbi:MAG: hypothetical protein EAY75_03595 [Bacteroidetes bacterium]|nr:MAG: hypothetical protein EAY75_03595 [Bacteroidota bacterium]
MKNLILVQLFILSALNPKAQLVKVYPPFYSPATLSTLPLVYTGAVPQIFMPGDAITKPHTRTHVVEATSTRSDINTLIEVIKKVGMQQGVDALMLLDLGKPSSDFNPEALPTFVIAGVGIKFHDNVGYLDTILKRKSIEVFDDKGEKVSTKVLQYTWRGQLEPDVFSNHRSFYIDSMMAFDAASFLEGHNDFYKIFINPDSGYIDRLATASSCTDCPGVKHQFVDQNPPLINTRVSSGAGPTSLFTINPRYIGPLLDGVVIQRKGANFLFIYYKYDRQGRIEEERWEIVVRGKAQLWLKVYNSFYNKSALLD